MLIMIISQSRKGSTSHKQKHIVRITTMEPCTVLKITKSTMRCWKTIIGQALCLTNEQKLMNLISNGTEISAERFENPEGQTTDRKICAFANWHTFGLNTSDCCISTKYFICKSPQKQPSTNGNYCFLGTI